MKHTLNEKELNKNGTVPSKLIRSEFYAVWQWNGEEWECVRRQINSLNRAKFYAEQLVIVEEKPTKVTYNTENANEI